LPIGSLFDVGWKRGLLASFINISMIVTNLTDGDLISDGLFLPFGEKTFEIVTSLDVLEHIRGENRSQLINELIRVARKKVIFVHFLVLMSTRKMRETP
jgi:hypothetical protein